MGLLEVRHRVRVGALDAVLAAHHVVEAERGVVVGQPAEVQRPARPQRIAAERARGLREDRLRVRVLRDEVQHVRVLATLSRTEDRQRHRCSWWTNQQAASRSALPPGEMRRAQKPR